MIELQSSDQLNGTQWLQGPLFQITNYSTEPLTKAVTLNERPQPYDNATHISPAGD